MKTMEKNPRLRSTPCASMKAAEAMKETRKAATKKACTDMTLKEHIAVQTRLLQLPPVPICQSRIILIRVLDATHALPELEFRIKRTTQLRHLMRSYCKRQKAKRILFALDGVALDPLSTPGEKDLEDGDIILIYHGVTDVAQQIWLKPSLRLRL